MGNYITYQSICMPSHPFRQQFSKRYTSVGFTVSQRFGSIQLYKQNASQRVNLFIKEINLNTKDELISLARKLSKRTNQTHPNLLQIGETCGTMNTLRVYAQYIQHNIKKEVRKRRKIENQAFTLQQLQRILYQLISALSYLHDKKQFHGQIKMSDILIDLNGNIKLIDKAFSITSFKINQQGQNIQILKGKGILLPPSIMRCLENKKTQINAYDPFKADIFSIGMVMLEAASFNDSQLNYDYQNFLIRRQRLDMILAQLKIQYSSKFIIILQMMLVQYDEQRPSAKQVLNWIQQYQRTKTSKISNISQPMLFDGINMTFS